MKKIFLVLLVTLVACQTEPIDPGLLSNSEKIKKDSELFILLEKVSSDGDNPIENVVCLDFIYPFKVLIYDENLSQIGSKILTGDNEFSQFLGSLATNESISISYPIGTTLSDGSVFSVNNNSELKLAIDSCSKEDIIAYCNGLFGGCDCSDSICVWKIPYSINGDNSYVSGVFESNGDGTLHFSYNGNSYNGTWIFLFVDDKLHMNINIEGTSQVAQDWNIDRKIDLINEEIVIKNTPKNIILRKKCQVTDEYSIGDTGPAGGVVFYDKGSYSNGWRYIETNSVDLEIYDWGCSGTLINNCSSSSIGFGLFNSAQIVNFHDSLNNYYSNPSQCNPMNNGTVAAQKALLFEANNFSDWFLPSENELSLMYENLHLNSFGNFTSTNYWSAT